MGREANGKQAALKTAAPKKVAGSSPVSSAWKDSSECE